MLFFFLALVGQLIRLGAITGQKLIVDSSLLAALRAADPDAVWQKYAGRKAVFGYEVHTLLCRTAVAVAACRYERPEPVRRRAMVLAHV